MSSLYKRIRLQQDIIDKQNSKIKRLEQDLKDRDISIGVGVRIKNQVQNELDKLKSATLFQRIFKWKKLTSK